MDLAQVVFQQTYYALLMVTLVHHQLVFGHGKLEPVGLAVASYSSVIMLLFKVEQVRMVVPEVQAQQVLMVEPEQLA
jgi:hypothetical protein